MRGYGHRMYTPDPEFPPPPIDDIAIWRYMDLTKFLSLLEDDALHFSRIDHQSDDYEGSITRAMLAEQRQKWAYLTDEEYAKHFKRPIDKEAMKTNFAYIFLNCWHMNEGESAAMWSLYQGGQPQGLAVRSTFRRLAESITDECPIRITPVKYIDYDRNSIPTTPYLQYIYKRRSFDHERELRALYIADRLKSVPVPPEEIDPNAKWHSTLKTIEVDPPDPGGVKIRTDLDRLVERVYVSPQARPWYAELIRSLLRRYGRQWAVQHSSMDADPVY